MFSSKLALCLLLAIGAEALRHGSVRMALVPQSHQQSLVSSTQKVLRTFQVAGVMLSAAALKPLAASASAPTSASAASAGSAGSAGSVASVASVGSVDFQAVRDEIGKLYTADPNKGPTLVRLAWHSSGTYDKMSRTGGSQGGTVRFTQELAHGANAGLQQAVHWLEPVYATYKKQGLSHADLYTLAGVEAIRLMGGPSIGWRYGRVDSMDPRDVTPDGRLPAADKGNPMQTAAGLREVFGRMGFGDREIVALSGAHALGRCHASASGYDGPWTPTPTSFNNLYYVLLLQLEWRPNEAAKKFQYQDPSGKLMMLPSDLVLLQDERFLPLVKAYSADQRLFFRDFALAFQKLEELGTKDLLEV